MAIKVSSTTVIDDNRVLLANNTSVSRTAPTISGGALALDLNSATIFDVSLNASITSITFSNIQSSGKSSSFILMLTADGNARTVVWPASFIWPSGLAPIITSTNGKKDIFTAFTIDGGTTWQAFISGQNI